MKAAPTVTLRVTGIRSQNPRGFGGAIFTGVPVNSDGGIVNAGTYVVVMADRSVLGENLVERGQWWTVRGPLAQREAIVDGFRLIEQQINANYACLDRPSGEHIVTYLAECAAFEGIGTVKARRLWERFGDALYGLLDAGDATPFADVLSAEVARTLVDSWAVQGEAQTLQWLQANGFSVPLGRKVLRYFGDDARASIEADPYRLLSFSGSWKSVDHLAREQFGVALNDPRRLRGAVEEACYRTFTAGHTLMLTADLMANVTPLLGKPPIGLRWRDVLAAAVTEGVKNGHIVQASHGLQQLGSRVMERQVAQAICDRLQGGGSPLLPAAEVEHLIAASEAEDAIELNTEQRQAIRLAAQYSFACLTGGAGVGKTTVLKSLYRVYQATGTKVLQVALAGRAAKRMQESTGIPASTIASFLNGVTDSTFDGPTVLVIDEASMVDIISMSRLCQVLKPHVRLVLAGDPYQLMPVGPGLILHCLVALPQVPLVELKTVKRYGGDIAAVASAFRAGKWPSISSNETAPVAFLPCENSLIAETVVELYALDPQSTQVLAPLRGGPAGTKLLNRLCQQRFTARNPAMTTWSEQYEQPQLWGFHLEDQVLCTRNLWDQGLQNGSQGRVVEVAPEVNGSEAQADRVLAWVEWDDGIRRAVTLEMLEHLELGFAITVHKAQGSQWRRVVIPVSDSRLLDRTLLYTALTRAQHQVILVGDVDAARRAILAPPRALSRQVGLDLTLQRMLEDIEAIRCEETAPSPNQQIDVF